jgi:hypothetical protein
MFSHPPIKGGFSGVSERWMSDVMCEASKLQQVSIKLPSNVSKDLLVEAQTHALRYLSYLKDRAPWSGVGAVGK